MPRPSGPKNRCGGKWTEAKFNAFIKNLLRQGTRKWGPIQDVKKRCRVGRGQYRCDGCGSIVGPTTIKDGKRVGNFFVDHIEPIIDPARGFVSWDETIERMFCEAPNLQGLCGDCHSAKTTEERAIAAARRQKEKEGND